MSGTTMTEGRVTVPAAEESQEPGATGRLATGWRLVVGLFYVGSAVFNLVVTYPNAEIVYESFADLAWPLADTLVRSVVLPLAGAFTLAVVLFELVAGLLILHRGRVARWGLVAAVAWLVALIPFLSWYGVANVVLVFAIVPLLRREPDRSLVDLVAGRVGSRSSRRVLRMVGIYQVTVGVGVAGWWATALASGSVPEIAAGEASIWFHLAAEGLMALLLIAGGWLLVRSSRRGPIMSAMALGSLLYSAVNSAGYFAESGGRALVLFFGVVVVLTVAAVLGLSRRSFSGHVVAYDQARRRVNGE